jgi:Amt family ammonium transporter
MAPMYDTGDTTWMIVSTALVLLMILGLALFYAGRVRSKHSLGMIMYTLAALLAISVTWVLVGFTLAFGPDVGNGLVGNLKHAGLEHLAASPVYSQLTFPPIAFAMFQLPTA